MRRTLAIAFTCVLFLAGIAAASPEPELVAFFSFEQDFEGWATEHITVAPAATGKHTSGVHFVMTLPDAAAGQAYRTVHSA